MASPEAGERHGGQLIKDVVQRAGESGRRPRSNGVSEGRHADVVKALITFTF